MCGLRSRFCTYKVTVIRQGREDEFIAFWGGNEKVNTRGETLHSDLVGFTKWVEARNLEEAISKVRLMHPELTIFYEYSAKIA
jgi:hypothetical protein